MEDYSRIVKVGDLQLSIRYSNKALLSYLNRLSQDPDGIDSLYHYFYDLASNGARSAGNEFKYTFDEFYDLVDPVPDALTNFQLAVSSFSDKKAAKKK